MQAFYQGDREEFYSLWETHFPQTIRQNDPLYQKLDFYINIYFAIFPIHSGVDGNAASVWI
jgi:LisH domain-containing protein ARMC9